MAPNLKQLLDELEERIEALKILYEQYFMGLEKLEPLKERQIVARIVRRAQTQQTKNTAARFRLNSLNQRFLSYQNYWNRITRQIEMGTYHRDLARVERDMKRRGINVDGLSKLRNKGELEAALMQGLAEAEEPAPAADDSSNGGRAVREFSPEEKAGMLTGEHRIASTAKPPPIPGQQPPPVPAAARKPAARAAPVDPDDRMKRLYKAYVGAKQRTGESTDGLTYDRLVRTLQKQVPAIQKKTGCKRVDFKIQIKEGKAVLKAVPVK
jgi:hypothetical protein